MHRVLRSLTLIAGALSAAHAGASDGEAVRLQYRFEQDEAVHLRVTQQATLTTQKGPIVETARNDAQMWKHYKVVDLAEDGTATLELVIDRVQMMVKFNEEAPLTVDSSHPQEDIPGPYKNVLRTIGRPLARIVVAPDGRMIRAEKVLPKELQIGITATTEDDTDPNDPGKNPFVVMPKEPVRVGDTWEDDVVVQVNVSRTLRQPVTLRRRYSLQSVEGDVARIALRTDVITPIRDPQLQMQLIQRCPEGLIEFDIERGCILSRELATDETVLGGLGPSSQARATSTHRETLLTPDEAAEQVTASEKTASR